MTYFPHQHLQRTSSPATRAFAAVRQTFKRDILWDRPVFRAPSLTSPRVVLDPLPFTATRITQRAAQR